MLSPREISSDRQGALTPTTARLVAKADDGVTEGATPRSLDVATRSPWANLSVDTTPENAPATATPSVAPMPVTAAQETVAVLRSGPTPQVPTQAGILPERYTSDLEHWQSPADLPERRLMVQRIIAMTRNKRIDPTSNSPEAADRTPSLAKRTELSLYSRAASFNEYKDLNTLRRRLQSLVALSFHEAAVSRRVAVEQSTTKLGKRKLLSTPFGVSRLMIKRPRVGLASSLQLKRMMSFKYDSESFFMTNEDVLQAIFSFLPGADTIRCCAINRFAARVLPKCVFSLDVEIKQMEAAFERSTPSFLCQYPNLERLSVYNNNKPCDQQEDGPSLHAWGCSELDISHDNAGEEVVKQIAESIELGACRSCPLLEDLLLGGNGFSDVGTVDVAWLLRVGSLPFLTRLDIRRNYIGESGLKRIMAALAVGRCPNLKYLCMGGNIITDNCVAPVVDLLSSSLCPQMRFLGLEDNFLSARGVHCIIQAAVAALRRWWHRRMSYFIPPVNYGMIEEDLYRSGQPNELNFPFLERLNLKKIIYLAPEEPNPQFQSFVEEQEIELIFLGGNTRMESRRKAWEPLSEETVLAALEIILDRSNYPLYITCHLGRDRTGAVVGCLRKIQQWHLSSIFEEYRRFAGSKVRLQNEQFIELFDTDLVTIPQNPPPWLRKHP
ncbi:TPA: hypothetical protein N0F65_009291 [Lagenidium giganteum]|uniref:protein-tyrosine-phosphatase n=1 Tax=Lagenidium giganteum TaxID=4803 RepID=A0AAV2YLX0_9STRA|nr:TPA: hypothetical protein N0F65_009291 [Lagenidium giganteum]